jgi:hypothetical protein
MKFGIDRSIEGKRNAVGETNDEQREIVARMAREHGTVWLGRINALNGFTGLTRPCLWQWDGSLVTNFGADFVLPTYDETLVTMIEEFRSSGVVGRQAAACDQVDAIFARAAALGGRVLLWS